MIPSNELPRLPHTAEDLVLQLDRIVLPLRLDRHDLTQMDKEAYRYQLAYDAGARSLVDDLVRRIEGDKR